MNIVRRAGMSIVGLILFASLIGAAWADITARTFRDRDTVKSWLSEGTFYDNITSAVLEGLQSVEGEQTGTVPANDPKLQARVREIFTPDFLKENTENFLDGTYNWLNGDVAKPDFVIDLSDVRTRLASAIGQYAGDRATGLPVCTVPVVDYDALNTNCVPAGLTATQIASTVESEFLNNPEFLGDEVLTADTLKDPAAAVGSNTFFDTPQAENVRRSYQFGTWAAPILLFLGLLSAVAIVLLSSTRRAGLLRAGGLILGSGIVLAIGWLITKQTPQLLNDLATTNFGTTKPATQKLISELLEVITVAIRDILGWYALIYVVLGVILMIVSRFIGRQRSTTKPLIIEDAADETANSKTSTTASATDKPKSELASKKEPPKIQL